MSNNLQEVNKSIDSDVILISLDETSTDRMEIEQQIKQKALKSERILLKRITNNNLVMSKVGLVK